MNRREFSKKYINFIFAHRIGISTFIFIITCILLFLSTKLTYSARVTDLLPPTNKKVSEYLFAIDKIGLTDSIIVVVSRKDGKPDPDNIELYSEIFTDYLIHSKEFTRYFDGLDFNINTKLQMIFTPFFLKKLWVIVPFKNLPEFIKTFNYNSMKSTIEKNKMLLQTGSGSFTLIKKDPLNILSFLESYSREIKGKLKISLFDGYYFSKDKTLQVFFIKTKGHADNLKYTTSVMNLLFKTVKKAEKEFKNEIGNENIEIDVRFTGPHPITYYDKNVAQNDMFSSLWLSFVLVILIFIIGFRNPLSFIYAIFPLVIGEIWTFGLSYLLVGRINILTSIVGAILVGLGIDFSIHLYSRFLEEEVNNRDRKEALIKTIEETGFATIAGGLTTAAAFSSMILSNFKGLREFGIVSSIGIVSTLISCFLIIPLIIAFRKNIYKPGKIAGFGTRFFHSIVDRHPKKVVFSSLLIILFFFFNLIQIKFNTSLRELRSKTNPALKTQTFLTKKLGGSLRSFIVILKGKDEKDIEKQFMALKNGLKNQKISKIDSIFSFLPLKGEQEKNIDYLSKIQKPDKISENFFKILSKEGFETTDYYKTYIESIEDGLNHLSPISFKDLLQSSIYPLLKNYLVYLNKKKEFVAVIKIYPKIGLWHKKFTETMVKKIDLILKNNSKTGSFVTGIDVVINEIKRLVKRNFAISTWLSLIFVFSIVFIHFKNIKHTLLSFVPLTSGIIIMLGALKISGDNISLYNFIATPMIIGIGIDSGIHILTRVLNSEKHSVSDAIIHTGKAIVFTSLTTIAGFGSLYISHFEGFKSLGFSTIVGVGACMFFSLIFFPALLKLIISKESQ